MMSFVKANDERVMNDRKFLARATYNSGLVAAKGFSGKLIKFDELYKFPNTKPKKTPQQTQAELMAWAIQVQAQTRRDKQQK